MLTFFSLRAGSCLEFRASILAAEPRLASRRGEWGGEKKSDFSPPHSPRRLANRGSAAKIPARNTNKVRLLVGETFLSGINSFYSVLKAQSNRL